MLISHGFDGFDAYFSHGFDRVQTSTILVDKEGSNIMILEIMPNTLIVWYNLRTNHHSGITDIPII